MRFREAVPDDIKDILALYKSVVGSKFCTWDNEYPDMIEINSDMANNGLFVLEDNGIIAGAISLEDGNEIAELPCWKINDKAMEFARVVVRKDYQGRRLAEILVTNIEKEAIVKGCSAMHILVAKENIPAYKTYFKLGYSIVGETNMYETDFYCCEKAL